MSVTELFLPLAVGGCVIAAPAARRDQQRFREVTEQFQPSVIQATPSFWRLALASRWAGAPGSRLWCGGEALTPALAEQLLPLCADLWNLYGPTEATVWASAGRVEASQAISLGSPLPGTRLALIDQAGLPDRGGRTARGDHHLRPGTRHVVPGPAGADQGAVHRPRYP